MFYEQPGMQLWGSNRAIFRGRKFESAVLRNSNDSTLPTVRWNDRSVLSNPGGILEKSSERITEGLGMNAFRGFYWSIYLRSMIQYLDHPKK